MQPQGGALECAEISVCVPGEETRGEGYRESHKEKEHEGERRGSFADTAEFVLRAEQSRSHICITSTHTWSAGDYWKILGVWLLLLILGSNNALTCIYLANWIETKTGKLEL